jgi:hypothetical protein
VAKSNHNTLLVLLLLKITELDNDNPAIHSSICMLHNIFRWLSINGCNRNKRAAEFNFYSTPPPPPYKETEVIKCAALKIVPPQTAD